MRRFVIGDIHGCSKALRTLIECIDPAAEDELVFLGDYVDRGPDSRGVIDQVIELQSHCRVIPLRGNHEIMLQSVAFGGMNADIWISSGGKATVTSYGGSLEKIPVTHREFLRSLRPHYETTESIFVHANYDARVAMDELGDELRYWTHLGPAMPPPHFTGKRVYVGHTPQANGCVLDMGYLVGVDTYCFGTGYLSAMNIETDEVIQVDKKGFRRRVPAEAIWEFMARCGSLVRAKMKRKQSKNAAPATETAEPPQCPLSPPAENEPDGSEA